MKVSAAKPLPAAGKGSQMTAADIARQIEIDISNREYLSGERLTESALASKFKVSRGPIREALRMLAGSGVITLDHNRGARVTRITDAEIIAASEIHGLLLGLAARRACQHASPAQREMLLTTAKALAAIARCTDKAVDDFVKQAGECAKTLGDISGSVILFNLLTSVLNGPARTHNRYGLSARAERVRRANMWVSLARLIESGDRVQAERAARRIQEEALAAAAKIGVPLS